MDIGCLRSRPKERCAVINLNYLAELAVDDKGQRRGPSHPSKSPSRASSSWPASRASQSILRTRCSRHQTPQSGAARVRFFFLQALSGLQITTMPSSTLQSSTASPSVSGCSPVSAILFCPVSAIVFLTLQVVWSGRSQAAWCCSRQSKAAGFRSDSVCWSKIR